MGGFFIGRAAQSRLFSCPKRAKGARHGRRIAGSRSAGSRSGTGRNGLESKIRVNARTHARLGEESESDKIENEKDMGLKTSLKLNLEESISNLSLFEEDVVENNEKENNVLLTQMNPPPSYVKKLLNDDNFFKQFDKEEYYMGIEKFKDEINRQFLKTLNF